MSSVDFRVGQGFDVHRYGDDRPLRLCGVDVPGETGLHGHSDADVGLHAVTDAVLGAVGADDIGALFPPSDPQWRDANSTLFLSHALELAAERGFTVVNCDLTFIGERPRIGEIRRSLAEGLARRLGVSVDAVGVKATTTEGMGFTGRGEGLAALAVVLLVRNG